LRQKYSRAILLRFAAADLVTFMPAARIRRKRKHIFQINQ
jgi:hypothetical protein